MKYSAFCFLVLLSALPARADLPIKDAVLQSDLNAGGFTIANLPDPSLDGDAVSLRYLQDYAATASQGALAESALQPGGVSAGLTLSGTTMNDGTIFGGILNPSALAILDFALGENSNIIRVNKSAQASDTRTGLDKSDFTRPFATISEAKTASTAGDTIVVEPGEYSEGDLLKDGVSLDCALGSSVVHAASGALFDDHGASVVAAIRGDKFTKQENGSAVFKVTGTGTVLHVSAQRVEGGVFPIGFDEACFWVNAGTVYANVSDIRSVSVALLSDGGSSGRLYAEADSIEAGGNVIDWGAGELFVTAKTLRSTGGGLRHTSGGTSFIRADRLIATRPVTHQGGSSTLEISLIQSSSDADMPPVYVDGSGLSIVGAKIVSGVAADAAVSLDSGSTVTLRDCVLVAGASSTYSVTGSGTVRVLGTVYANKAVDPGITVIGGTVSVSTDVQ